MSTEAKYSPQGSYAGYVYGYLTSLLGFILTVIGEHFYWTLNLIKPVTTNILQFFTMSSPAAVRGWTSDGS